MKILIAHNDYGKYSGEEAVVDRMASMLDARGYEIAQLRESTAGMRDSISGKVKAFVGGIWCPDGRRKMRRALELEKPDIVNVHNLYPFISPAALQECKRAGVPVVMTVHNFRLICPTGLFMRDGHACEHCLSAGNEWGCVRHNCEGSWPKSIAYAARNAVARWRRDYLECVDVYACITAFQRSRLIAAGFPEEKIVVIPNSIDAGPAPMPRGKLGAYVAFSGRISREKGVDIIIETARRHPEIPFRIAGALRDAELVENLPVNVVLEGHLEADDYLNFCSNARFFVMASRCYEGFPVAILEAARYALPMVAPNHGGFTEIVGEGRDAGGLLFEPGSVDDFERRVVELWNAPQLAESYGAVARKKLEEHFASDVIADSWNALFSRLAAGVSRTR